MQTEKIPDPQPTGASGRLDLIPEASVTDLQQVVSHKNVRQQPDVFSSRCE